MMSCIARDVKATLSSDHFGESVVWQGVTITAIFDDEDIEVQNEDGVGEIIHQSVLLADSTDFPGIAEGQTVTAGGNDYTIRYWMDDGTGSIEIFMEKQ